MTAALYRELKKIARIAGLVFVLLMISIQTGFCQHYKSVEVVNFKNPKNWVIPYSPGEVIAEAFKSYLKSNPYLLLAGSIKQPYLENQAQIIIRGDVIRFDPALQVIGSGITDEGVPELLAEVHTQVQIVHRRTQRVLATELFWGVGGPGGSDFGVPGRSLKFGQPEYLDTSMGWAIDKLVRKALPFILNSINHQPLEGEVVEIHAAEETTMDKGSESSKSPKKMKPESDSMEIVSINVGRQHGIRVRDAFEIYSVQKNVTDPETKLDLGDRLERLGSVIVFRTGESFSDAYVLAGGDFKAGQLVRAVDSKPNPALERMAWKYRQSVKSENTRKELFSPPYPAGRNIPTTVFGANFFSLFGASVDY